MPSRRNDRMVRIAADFPDLDWTVPFTHEERVASLDGAEILVIAEGVCCEELGKRLVEAKSLRWIQFSTAGCDQCIRFGLPFGIPITSGSGIKARTVAEHAFLLLLALFRQLRALETERAIGRLSRADMFPRITSLEGATLVIIGHCHVGRNIARKEKAFDMRTIVVSRSAAPDANADEILPRERLRETFAKADAVVLCTQPSHETDAIIGAAEMPP